MKLQLFGFFPINEFLNRLIQTAVKGVQVTEATTVKQTFPASVATVSAAASIKAATTCSNVSTTTITTGFTQPACPKNVSATSGGTLADIKNVQVTVTGTNFLDQVITETLPVFTAGSATTVTGSKAFKTITSVSIPAMTGPAATVSIGHGEKLGLPFKLSLNTVLQTFLGGALQGTAPTVTVDPVNIENNTVKLSSALNGTQVDVILSV